MTGLFDRIRAMSIEIGDCWEWQGALLHAKPCPVMRHNGRVWTVRRHIAQELGLPLHNKLATHKCGNELCVNPEHVVMVTRKKLQQRTAEKGMPQASQLRRKRISDKARRHAKLTMEIAQQIREAEGTQRNIAVRFGVSQSTVKRIKRGESWRDYSNPFTSLIGVKR